jgi:hypothetical protein
MGVQQTGTECGSTAFGAVCYVKGKAGVAA